VKKKKKKKKIGSPDSADATEFLKKNPKKKKMGRQIQQTSQNL
jgi:hypothetical protein